MSNSDVAPAVGKFIGPARILTNYVPALKKSAPRWPIGLRSAVKQIVVFALTLLVFASRCFGYGQTGHEIVGGVADKLIANTPAGEKVRSLIDGITLEKAALIPDEIRGWDKNGADDLRAYPHYTDHANIDKQLRDFWRANPPTQD